MNKEPNYLHRCKSVNIKSGKKVVNEEGIYSGDKGLTMKHYKSDDGNVEKMVVIKKHGKYVIRTIKNGVKHECVYTNEELVNLLKADYNKYKFILDFLTKEQQEKKENENVEVCYEYESNYGRKKSNNRHKYKHHEYEYHDLRNEHQDRKRSNHDNHERKHSKHHEHHEHEHKQNNKYEHHY